MKALELKALHQPLSPEQQEKYDAFVAGRSAGEDIDEMSSVEEEPDEDMEEGLSGDMQAADEDID